MKKLLIISPYYFEPHRWTMSTVKLAKMLSSELEVIVLAAGPPEKNEISENLKIILIRDFFLPAPLNYGIMPGLPYNLLKILAKEKPDYFLINKFMFFSSLAIPMLRLLKKEVYVATDTFPGIDWFPPSKIVSKFMSLYARLIGVPCLRLAKGVILFHEGLVETAQRLNLPFVVIKPGVDETENNETSAVKFRNNSKEITISYIGRLESVKGVQDLLAVAEELCKSYENIQFFIVGYNEHAKELVRKYKSSRIRLLGFLPDVSEVLNKTDIFVLPSYAEGLPNALLEAMAAGCACAAASVGGVKVLLEEGVTGRLFPAGNFEAIKSVLIELCLDNVQRKKLGESAKAFVLKEYGLEQAKKKYLEIFSPN